MSERTLDITINADSERARRSVGDLAGDIEQLAAKLGGELGARATEAAAKLRALGEQESAIQQFLKLQTEVGSAERALKEITRQADAYAKQITATGVPTEQEARHLAELRTRVDGASTALAQQQDQLAGAAAAMQRHGVATDGASRALARVQGDIASTVQGVGQLDPRLQEVTRGWRTGAQAATEGGKRTAAAADAMGERMGLASQAAKSLGQALATAFTLREAAQAMAGMEGLQAGLTAVSGSAERAAADMDFVRGVAVRIGADVSEAGRAYLGLAAATKDTAVEGEPTRQVFEAVATAMGKAGKSSAETSNALQALSQMASKGVVQSEELRGQLGEALPGALSAAARGLGITTAELMKLVEEGKITAQDLFPALSKGLNELYGGAPQAQTLSQEFTNVKNSFMVMSERIGQAGGLTALKTAAEVAQTAIVLMGEAMVAAGRKIGVTIAALVTRDFKGLSQAYKDIEADSRDSLVKAAQHNEVLRKTLEATGNEATKAALAQQQSAQGAASAGAAAAQSGDDWIKLNNGYRLVLDSVREQLTLAEKEVAAAKARGDAAVAQARLLGDEEGLRKAIGRAAADEAKALADLAAKRQTELSTLQAQLKSLQDEVAGRGQVSDARAKEMAELEQLIAKKQIEADTTRAQAAAAQQNARAKGEEAQAAQAALSATQAATVARVADARASISLLEAQKSLAAQGEQLARLMGDESAARRFRIQQLEIDIKLTQAKAEVQRAEAEGSIAVANATLAELRAKGELTAVKEAELRASIKVAEARLKEADATAQSARVTQQAIDNLRRFGNEAGQAGEKGHGAGQRAAAGWHSAAGAIGGARDALRAMGIEADQVSEKVQRLIGQGQMLAGAFQQRQDNWNRELDQSQIKNRPGMNPVDAVPSFSTVEEADVWKERFLEKYARQNPFSVKSGALGSFMRDLTLQEWAAEREAAETRTLMQEAKKRKEQQDAGGASPGAGSASSARPAAGSAGVASGASYVSNITIQGQARTLKYADRQSQIDGDALIRMLAEGKGVAQ